MRIAVQNPAFIFFAPGDPATSFNGYNRAFFDHVRPIIYLTDQRGWKNWLFGPQEYRRRLSEVAGLEPETIDIVTNEGELRAKADVLLCFNEWPLDICRITPPRRFDGLKIWHVLDCFFRPREMNTCYERGGVDYIMGHTNLGEHCSLFRHFYPSYVDRVIPVPFGFSNRFLVDAPFEERKNMAIALGAVNPVDELGPWRTHLHDYIAFYHDRKWMHEWRRLLVEHENELKDCVDSFLPRFPETKNIKYDAVKAMVSYQMFANDESILNFPPARTYEGPAAGCVMVSSDHACYKDLGFVDGVNCVMHARNDLTEFAAKVRYYQQHTSELAEIARAGRTMVRANYSHAAVARTLFAEIENRYVA